ncbi:MAG: hypothetical protein ACRD3T_16255 [Terriglobia bacterium]
MYTLVALTVLLTLVVLASAILFVFSVVFMIVEETVRSIGEGTFRFAPRIAHAVKQISAHNPASEAVSSR